MRIWDIGIDRLKKITTYEKLKDANAAYRRERALWAKGDKFYGDGAEAFESEYEVARVVDGWDRFHGYAIAPRAEISCGRRYCKTE